MPNRRPLSREDIAELGESIRAALADPDASLSTPARYRYEGALVAIEAVLGVPPSLILDEPGRFLL